MSDSTIYLYRGEGTRSDKTLPLLADQKRVTAPEGYTADPGLRNAVNVALLLGQPLLLMGEPGTGKSLAAHSVAYELNAGVPNERGEAGPLVFHCKTTSSANDLFYRFDALGRFHAARRPDEALPPADAFITYEALGLAILLANPDPDITPLLPPYLRFIQRPMRCVVLIDEIDKAPRDLPNDVLNEIERMTFRVRETGKIFTADDRYRPFLVLTSNSERDLPHAFLRRCAFYHVVFPGRERLLEILVRRLGETPDDQELYAGLVELFTQIRELKLRKPPATAELIACTRFLASKNTPADAVRRKSLPHLEDAVCLLAKNPEDRQLLMEWLKASSDKNS